MFKKGYKEFQVFLLQWLVLKILSPLSKVSEVQDLVVAGAEEFYCGIVTKEWEKRFSFIASINLRHDRVANFQSFEELGKAVSIASSHNLPVFCVFNAVFYSKNQFPIVLNHARKAVDAGISKLIVSDPALISFFKENDLNVEIALSTAAPAFNSASFSFFKGLGVKRIVLPRHLTLEEISSLAKTAKVLNLELEAFVLNALCPYIDGLCTLQHVGKNPESVSVQELACRMPFEVKVFSNQSDFEKRNAFSRAKTWQNTFPESCGLCALPSFEKIGIGSLKIAGRGNSSEKKIADVKMVSDAIGMLALPEQEFKTEMHKLFFEANHIRCNFKTCYYAKKGLL